MSETAVYALNTISYILLILYFPYVFLNVCFTTDFLVTADIPYYQNPSPIDTIWTDRYKVEWWLLAVGILQIGIPALAAHAWLPVYPQEQLSKKIRIPKPAIYILSKVVIIGVLVVFVLIFIFRIIQLVPGILGCDDQMFCRNENPAKQSPNTANALFIVHFIFLVVFIILDGIYLAFIYIWEERAEFVYRTSWLAQTKVGQLFSRSLFRGVNNSKQISPVVVPPPTPSIPAVSSQQHQTPIYTPLLQQQQQQPGTVLLQHNPDHTYTEITMKNFGHPLYPSTEVNTNFAPHELYPSDSQFLPMHYRTIAAKNKGYIKKKSLNSNGAIISKYNNNNYSILAKKN